MTRPTQRMILACAALTFACTDDPSDTESTPDAAIATRNWSCVLGDEAVEFALELGCREDFLQVASEPFDASIPGARSVKTVIDRVDGDALHIQNSRIYPTHWDFATAHLSGQGRPVVPLRADFNTTEYSSPSRRFLLGAVTYYEGPDLYCYEISPYDSASAEMIETAWRRIAEQTWIGGALCVHPTSEAVEREAAKLPAHIPVVTTDTLFGDIDYQALNHGESFGRLRFTTADALDDEYVSFRDIVVLDRVPNDISVVVGIITAEFQTPLSHINVLSQNRGTPNMALLGAYDRPDLRVLDGEWVRLEVGPFDYAIEAVDAAAADAWWEANKPGAVQVPGMNLDARSLTDVEDLLDLETAPLRDAIKTATRAYGGKAAHYAALARVEDMPVPKAFAVPVYYYDQFMRRNGFDRRVDDLLADPHFRDDPEIRDAELTALRDAMETAPVDPDFEAALRTKLATDFPGVRMRFRSSTNAEDLDGFTGAGLYTSKTGDPSDPDKPVLDAIRKVWASVWFFRAFEERSYRSIDHRAVGMALLVHRSFPDEAANGVALTGNPFDTSGLEPAFYVNVQLGEASVVQPEPGVTSDQFIYHFDQPGRPVVYIAQSSLVPEGEHVLDASQIRALGDALDRIRAYFRPAYGAPGGAPTAFWAMDVEFKFDGEPGESPTLFVKQARPYGRPSE